MFNSGVFFCFRTSWNDFLWWDWAWVFWSMPWVCCRSLLPSLFFSGLSSELMLKEVTFLWLMKFYCYYLKLSLYCCPKDDFCTSILNRFWRICLSSGRLCSLLNFWLTGLSCWSNWFAEWAPKKWVFILPELLKWSWNFGDCWKIW